MDENKNQLNSIDNKNEKNIVQMQDIPNENNSEKDKQNGNSNKLETKDDISNGKKMSKSKGFVKVFRNFLKKKDNSRKNVLYKRFIKWRKHIIKGSKLKKTIIVRISVSKEKDLKYKNKLELEKDDEKEKSKSVNKNEVKSFNKNMKFNKNDSENAKDKKINDKKHKITKIDNKNINVINIINSNNLGNFEFAKKIKNYKGKSNDEQPNENRNKNDKLDNINKYNKNLSKNNKIVEINSEKQKPKTNINVVGENKNIFPINNLNIQLTEIKGSSKKNQLNNSANNSNKTELKNPNITNNQRSNSFTQPVKYNNVNIIFTSSSKKKKNDMSINNINKNNHFIINTNQKVNEISKNKNLSYKNNNKTDNKKIYSVLPPKVVHIDLNENKGKIMNEYNPYEAKKSLNNKRKISDSNKSFSQGNKIDYNIYKRNTYQTKNKKDKDNESDISGKYNRRDKNNTYSQKTTKLSLKGGVTTVIQHYSGNRKQYQNYKK